MRYYQPYGAAANAPYVNGNPSTGIQGSIPPAEQMEHPQREIVDFITRSGLTPTELDLGQLAKGVQLGKVKYVAAAGTANAVTATLSPVPAAYQAGMTVRLKMSLANTGATTLNLNGIGAVAVVNADASALVGGEWGAATIVTFIHDGTNWQFIRAFNAAPNYAQKITGFFYAFANPAPGFTNLGAGVWTKISVTSEQYDREGWYDAANSRVQPTVPGFYYISGDCSFGSNTTLPTTGIRAFLNGTAYFATQIGDVPGSQYSTNSNGSRGVLSGVTQMNGTTDFLELFGYQDVVDSGGFRRASVARWAGWFLGR